MILFLTINSKLARPKFVIIESIPSQSFQALRIYSALVYSTVLKATSHKFIIQELTVRTLPREPRSTSERKGSQERKGDTYYVPFPCFSW